MPASSRRKLPGSCASTGSEAGFEPYVEVGASGLGVKGPAAPHVSTLGSRHTKANCSCLGALSRRLAEAGGARAGEQEHRQVSVRKRMTGLQGEARRYVGGCGVEEDLMGGRAEHVQYCTAVIGRVQQWHPSSSPLSPFLCFPPPSPHDPVSPASHAHLSHWIGPTG